MAAPTVAGTAKSAGPDDRPSRKAKKKEPTFRIWRIAGWVGFIGIWFLLSTYVISPNHLPSPVAIVSNMEHIVVSGEFWPNFWATMKRTLISLPIVFVLGATIGILMGKSVWWESFFRDIVTVLLSLPGLIIILLGILIMGLDPTGPIIAIVVTNFAFVTVQIWEGVKSLPAELSDMAKVYEVSRFKQLRHIILPALAPFLFTSFTYAFTLTWKLAMVSELFGGNEGVGFRMRVEFWQFNVAGMVAWALLLFIVTLLIERLLLKPLERHVLRWREATFQ